MCELSFLELGWIWMELGLSWFVYCSKDPIVPPSQLKAFILRTTAVVTAVTHSLSSNVWATRVDEHDDFC